MEHDTRPLLSRKRIKVVLFATTVLMVLTFAPGAESDVRIIAIGAFFAMITTVLGFMGYQGGLKIKAKVD